MKICLPYPAVESDLSASTKAGISGNFADRSQICDIGRKQCISGESWTTCDNCGGAGGFDSWDGVEGEEIETWTSCPHCRGSGWVEGEPPSLSLDDLDLRAPIDSLLRWWRCLYARDAWPAQRARIAAVCDRRARALYRNLEC